MTSSIPRPRYAIVVGDTPCHAAESHSSEHGRKHRQHHAFAAPHRSHGAQAIRRQTLRRPRVLQRRRRQPVHDQRHDDERDQAGRQRGERPHRPGHVDARVLFGELGDQHVWSRGGQEHRRHDQIALVEHRHQERADEAGRGPGLGAERTRDAERDWKQDAAGARGVGRRHRRHRQIGEHDRIAEAKRAAAEATDGLVRDAFAEVRLHDAAGEQEGRDDQPDRRVGEARERVLNRHEAEQAGRGDGEQRHRPRCERARHQRADGGGKEREQPPAARRHTGVRQQPDGGADGQRRRPAPAIGGPAIGRAAIGRPANGGGDRGKWGGGHGRLLHESRVERSPLRAGVRTPERA